MKHLISLASLLAVAAIVMGVFLMDNAPTTHAAGPPTLSISATGLTVTLAASGVSVDPYTGYNYGLTYDNTLLTFSGKANMLPGSPFCVDNGGSGGSVVVGCTLLSGSATYTGDLGSISFTATGPSGCATLTIKAYDGTNAIDGTYTLDLTSSPVTNPLGVSQVQIPVNGGSCVAPPTATPSPTLTPTATNTPTATATPTTTSTPISGQPDVVVFINASPPTSSSGAALTYILTVKNIGDAAAMGVSVSVTLPPGSVKTGGGPCPVYLAGHYVCPVPNLAPNDHAPGGPDEATITINARAPFLTRDTIVQASAIVAATNEPPANAGNNTSSTLATIGGCPDLNDDGLVSINDFGLAAPSFGKSLGDPGYNPLADQNGDNKITIADFALMAQHFGVSCRGIDSDGDGLSNYEETAIYHTNPNNPDTDGDGLPDGVEVFSFGTNPLNPDTDGDGYTDGQEAAIGKSPTIYCQIMRADVNMDGIVTINDLAMVVTGFGKTIPPANPRFDQNADNIITINDLGKMAQVFGLPVSACP
ncbi:MAG TPA: hypothetical protein VEZ14_07950 [Dehalococcoidia bacterium]|nr:hypothetical protein [Dehalococcoidia bacterium]